MSQVTHLDDDGDGGLCHHRHDQPDFSELLMAYLLTRYNRIEVGLIALARDAAKIKNIGTV